MNEKLPIHHEEVVGETGNCQKSDKSKASLFLLEKLAANSESVINAIAIKAGKCLKMEKSKALLLLLENSEQITPTFYRNIDTSEEFGVSRFVADRVYYLPKLLENASLTFIQDTSYLVSAESKDPNGNSIKLEHRFKATSESEAHNLYEKIYYQLAGVQLKIWLACWRLGDELRRYSYTCQLIDLMKIAYPERKGRFSVSDRTEFYDHLKSLEQTKLVFSKPKNSSNKPNSKNSTSNRKDPYQTI